MASVLSAVTTAGAVAQALPLKEPPDPARGWACPTSEAEQGGDVGPDIREASARLASEASQAMILGDAERARDLLRRAIELVPRDGELAYRYARVLEDLGDEAAVAAYCVVLAVAPEGDDASEARRRLRLLARDPAVPERAVEDLRFGVDRARAGDLEAAADAFSRALAAAPEWPEAWFDRGLVLAQLGQQTAAAEALRRYLDLRPQAEDARAVAELVGELSTPAPGPRAGTALTLGLILPGMGHFYSGRTGPGLVVMGGAAAAVAAALLVEDVTVRCLSDLAPGADCPPDQILEEVTDRPLMTPGLVVAAALAVGGAIEAAVRVGGRSAGASGYRETRRVPFPLISGVERARGGWLRVDVVTVRF